MTRQEENFIECCFNNKLSTIKTLTKHNVDITVSGYWGYRIAANKGYIGHLAQKCSIEKCGGVSVPSLSLCLDYVPAGFSPAYNLINRKAMRETPTQERLCFVII